MTSNPPIPVFCGDCNHDQTVVGKIASSLRCEACGSTNMGLTGVDPRPETANLNGGLTTEAQQRVAAPTGYGTGWGKPHPDPLRGWSEYAGPPVQTMPRSAPVADSTTCPVCHGSGYDLVDKTKCRECGGTGTITHATDRPSVLGEDATTTAQPAGGAGWHGASLQEGLTAEAMAKIPWIPDAQQRAALAADLGKQAGRPNTRDPYGPEHQNVHGDPRYRSRVSPSVEFDPDNAKSFYPKAPTVSPQLGNPLREQKDYDAPVTRPVPGYDPGLGYSENSPYQMNQAACPNCGHAPTQLVKDKNEDAWWHCPSCGPLVNIDARPEVNPYSPPRDFSPDRSMKTGGFLSRNRKTGRLLTVLAKIHEANDLDERDALDLARQTVSTYREGR